MATLQKCSRCYRKMCVNKIITIGKPRKETAFSALHTTKSAK